MYEDLNNDFPANTSTPGTIAIGSLDWGQITPSGDSDWFRVSLTAGTQYQFTIEAGTTNGLFDPQLGVYSFAGVLLIQATVGQGFQSKHVEYTPTASADYFLAASGDPSLTGTYKVTASAVGGTGSAANDTLTGTSGNDTIDGGAGIDTAVYTGTRASYTIARTSTGFAVSGGADGSDTLTNIERLQFANTRVATDLAGNAGITAKILGAVFGASFVSNKEYVGIGLGYLDAGMSYQDLMQLALDAKLGAGFSNTAVVDLLYQNLVGVPPSDADRSYWLGTLTSGQFSQASLGVMAADHDLNTTNINLVGLAQTGIEYVLA
jgi:hypothetical protein